MQRRGCIDSIRKLVGSRGDVLVTRDHAELEQAACHVVSSAASVVILCGGDGTYQAGVTALHRAAPGRPLPPIAFARAGTVSIVARNWGSARDIVSTVRRAIGPRESWRVTERATLSVSENSGATRIGFTLGSGLVASFFEEYDRRGAHGNAAAMAIVARLFVGGLRGDAFAKRVLAPIPSKVFIDGEAHPASAFSLILASVLRDVGLHTLVAHRAGEDPARPHVVASVLPPRGLALNWPRVVLGKPIADPNGLDRLAREARIEFLGGAGPYVLDGDTFRAEGVTVRAGPTITVVT